MGFDLRQDLADRPPLQGGKVMQFYSDPSRENDKWSLPDCEVWQATAEEIAETMEDEIRQARRLKGFELASVNDFIRQKLLEYIVREHGVQGGWVYQFCFPGCMPESGIFGPFTTRDEAIDDCRENFGGDY